MFEEKTRFQINFKCAPHHIISITVWQLRNFTYSEVRKVPKKSKNFNELLIEAIDEALNSLGESVKQSIYFHIENKFVAKQDIPENIKGFQGGLEKIFGAGAQFIEILIMKNLHAKIGITLTVESDNPLEFVNYVNAVKQSFSKKQPET
jgi:hypothetical protein